LNGSSIKSLLNKPHQPGQALLPLDVSQSAYGHFSLGLQLWTTRGRQGLPQGKSHHRRKASSQRATWQKP